MYLPKLNRHNIKKTVIDRFNGINRSGVTKDNEFYDTENLSSLSFPALSSFPACFELDSYETGNIRTPLFFLNQKLGYITSLRADEPDICRLIYNGRAITSLSFPSDATGASLVNFNGKTLMAKGKLAYEFNPEYSTVTTALSKVGFGVDIVAINQNQSYTKPTLRLSFVYEDMVEIGTVYQEVSDFPTTAEVNDLCVKKLECYRLIYKGKEGSKDIWQPVVSLRLRLDMGDGYRNFKKGDYIRLSGLKYWNWSVRELKELNRFVRIEEIDENGCYITHSMPLIEDYNIILTKMEYPTNDIPGYNLPVINNTGNNLPMLEGNISSCMPELDMLCTGANRVWGCNSAKGEIYASELGSLRNWSVFEGLSSDSYSLTVGSPGDFTACCNLGTSPVFFKEKEIIMISGSRPSSFSINSLNVNGVSRYCPTGLCVVENEVYYLGYEGVYVYNGSSAALISQKTGSMLKNIKNGVMAFHNGMLYVYGEKDEETVGFVYDINKDIWHRLKGERVIEFINYPDALLKVTTEGENSVISTLTDEIPLDYELSGATLKEKKWMWESGDISYGTTDKKYVRRISMDMLCDNPSELYISYNGEDFMLIGHLTPHPRGARKVYVFPKRCDNFRLRMEGEGKMMLYNLTKDVEEASENG